MGSSAESSAFVSATLGRSVAELLSMSAEFEDITPIYESRSGYFRLFRAKRYGKLFALKCLKEEYADNPELMGRLRKEFEIGYAIDHPNVVRFYGLEVHTELGLVVVMEWIDGCTLRQMIDVGNVERSTAINIAKRLASAIDYMHSLQIVHCDVKPENVMVTRLSHEPKLIDFGFSDGPVYDVLKQRGGTAQYMAPELADMATEISGATDVYSYGATLLALNNSCARPSRRLARIAKACMADSQEARPLRLSSLRFDSRNVSRGIFAGLVIVVVAMSIGLTLLHSNDSQEVVVVRDTVVVIETAEPDTARIKFMSELESNVTSLLRNRWERYLADLADGKWKKSSDQWKYSEDLETLLKDFHRIAENYVKKEIDADDPDYATAMSIVRGVVSTEYTRITSSPSEGNRAYESYRRSNP